MKVLLTVHQFFPDYRSGSEVLTLSVAKELQLRGHEVLVLTGHPVAGEELQQFDRYDYDGIAVRRFYYRASGDDEVRSEVESRGDNSRAKHYFMNICEDFQPDVVHIFHLDRLGSGLIEAAVELAIPVFMTPTDFWAVCPMGQLMLCDGRLCPGPNQSGGNCVKHVIEMTQKNLVGDLVRRSPAFLWDWLASLEWGRLIPHSPRAREVEGVKHWSAKHIARLNILNKIISPNRFMSEQLIRAGVSPRRITHCAFGIETRQVVRKSVRIRRQPFRLGYIGTLAPHKGCHVLIEAFHALPAGSAVLNIYGDMEDFPDYVHMLQTLASRCENVHFCGTFPNSEICRVMEDIDVLTVPSLWYENTPLVIYSAQDARCPLVASDLPGLSEVIEHEVNGLLFDAGNVGALAETLLRLIRNPELIGQLSEQAQEPKSISGYVDELMGIWQDELCVGGGDTGC